MPKSLLSKNLIELIRHTLNMIHKRLDRVYLQPIISCGVFIFFAFTFTVPSGYSYGAILLLFVSIVNLFSQSKIGMSGEDRILAYLLLASFLAALVAFIIHNEQIKNLDQSSRYLLFIPILFLLLKIPPSAQALWAGLISATLSALALALWQRYIQGNPRPDGFMTSAIPFGNLSIMAGILCLTGVSWANTQFRYARLWRIALCAGFLAGIYTSLLSGSRGGWLTLPVAFLIFIAAFIKKRSLKVNMVGVSLFLSAIGIVGISMQAEITARYEIAIAEIHDYASNRNAATSTGLRLEAWRAAMMSIKKQPIVGWGYREYEARLNQLVDERKIDISVTSLANTHNNFLEVWLHQGLFGFLVFLALFAVTFCLFCKRLRSNDHAVQAFALGGTCLLASFFVFSLTQVILGRNNGVIFFGLSLVIFWACMRNAEQKAAERNQTSAGQ